MADAAALFTALAERDLDEARRLLQEDRSLARARNADQATPLLAAAYRHDDELLSFLRPLVEPLDVFEAAVVGDDDALQSLLNAEPSYATATAPDGFFPLALAAFFGNPSTVELFLRRGADVDAVASNPMQIRALHAAAAARSAEIVASLLAAGADPNARQHGGWTALHSAAQHGDDEIARLLVEAGADPGAANDEGRTPTDLAMAGGHDAVVAVLGTAPSGV